MTDTAVVVRYGVPRTPVLLTVHLVLMISHTDAHAAGEWQLRKIDECDYPACYSWSTVRLDSNGRPHVLFQQDPNHLSGLRYACFRDGPWYKQEIERNCSAMKLHFVLDAKDAPHALYSVFNCRNEGLKYAHSDGQTWAKSLVYGKVSPSEGEMLRRFGCNRYSLNLMVSDANDLAVDANGNVHVAYVDPEKERLVYGFRPAKEASWKWESLECVGNHKLSVSRTFPTIRLTLGNEPWLLYKRYSRMETGKGRPSVHIELRLARKKDGEWNVETITDRLGFVDGQSKIVFGEDNQCAIAHTRCAARSYGDPSVTWVILDRRGGKWVKRFEGEPEDQLHVMAWVHGRLCLVLTRKKQGAKADGVALRDLLLLTQAESDWHVDNLAGLGKRQVVSAAMDHQGHLHALLTSTSPTSSTLEYGCLKLEERNRQPVAPPDKE